jgi:hypothetical protein
MHISVNSLAGKWLRVAIPVGGAFFCRMAFLIFTFFSGWIVSLGINSFFGATMGGVIRFDAIFGSGAGMRGVLHDLVRDFSMGISPKCRAGRLFMQGCL